jgi:azobenzene reductase
MNITIISGSPRANSSSLNVSNYVNEQLNQREDTQSKVFNLHQCKLELWSETAPTDDVTKELLESAQGYVFVVPEWHGMVPPALKNLFYYFNATFSHKPAYIIGVSSGTGGRYPITELRSSTYKNSQINYIPVSTVIDKVDEVIIAEGKINPDCSYIAQRIDEGLEYLLAYTAALKGVRQTEIFKEKRFKNGM